MAPLLRDEAFGGVSIRSWKGLPEMCSYIPLQQQQRTTQVRILTIHEGGGGCTLWWGQPFGFPFGTCPPHPQNKSRCKFHPCCPQPAPSIPFTQHIRRVQQNGTTHYTLHYATLHTTLHKPTNNVLPYWTFQ